MFLEYIMMIHACAPSWILWLNAAQKNEWIYGPTAFGFVFRWDVLALFLKPVLSAGEGYCKVWDVSIFGKGSIRNV